MTNLNVGVEVVELALERPFVIARESWESVTNVFVHVSDGAHRGIGESSPAARWGESVESVVEQIARVGGSLSRAFDLEAPRDLLPAGAARAAVDIALHDFAARKSGISLFQLLGLEGRPRPPTSLTVPIEGKDEMVARARSLAGNPILKLKVGFDGDVDAVAAIREVYSGTIRIDANEGWDEAAAVERLGTLARYDIELCEQPIRAGDVEALGRIAAASPIPIFADEEVSTAGDVARVAGAAAGVNLKLRKCGGIREFMAAAATARAVGLKVMIGCDLESGVAATAGAHVASLCDYVDLDGPTLLANDPYPGVRYDGAALVLPEGPGLGVDERAVA